MRAKNMRNVARRGLALFMSVVMAVSLLQLSALAAFGGSYENQTMDGYFLVNEEDAVTGTTEEATVTEDGFTLSKTIRQTGENAFDITLKVITSQTVTTNDAAIQLVIDSSGSMSACATCGFHFDDGRYYHYGHPGYVNGSRVDAAQSRMRAVKDAVAGNGGFLDSLLTNNTGKIYVSVIDFDSTATTACEWTDITNNGGLAKVKSAVNGLKAGGGTNLDAGLMLARNRLGMDAVKSAANKFTVLLTDGEPTFRTTKDSSSTTSITSNTDDRDGSACSKAERNQAKNMASAVKNLSKLYTICYGVSEDILYGSDKCQHCGQTRRNHDAVYEGWWIFGEWHYYCKDGSGKEYNGSVSVGDYLKNEIATPASDDVQYAFNTNDEEAVKAAFANITSSSTAGMDGGGTTVTDPMGDYIVLGDVTALSGQGVSASDGTITWTLDPAKAQTTEKNGVTTYTYEVTYPITLDTSAQGFREDVNYPTNGFTCLNVPQGNGTVKQIPFHVPGVFGKIPEVSWTVEYYLQGNAEAGAYSNYTLDDSDQQGSVDLWTSVNAPTGYESKYADQDYTFAAGETQMTITPTGENVMRLYYDHITEKVTVNHYYKTDRITAEGKEVPGTYPQTPNATGSEYVNINTSYTAKLEETYGGAAYTLDTADPGKTITVTAGGDNVIDLYYTRLEDERAITSAQVNHVYRTYAYELQNGRYVRVLESSTNETAEEAEEIRATTVFSVSPAPLQGYESFTLNTEEGDYKSLLQEDGTLSFVVDSNAENNVRTLYFDYESNQPQPITVTVNHYYTKTVTSVVNNEVVVEIDPNKELGKTETFTTYYVG